MSAGVWGFILQQLPSKLLLCTGAAHHLRCRRPGLLVNTASVAIFAMTQNGTMELVK